MKRSVIIFVAAAVISLIVVLATMQIVCYYVNRIYGTSYDLPTHHVTWLAK